MGDWSVHVFCDHCDQHLGQATFGDVWFTRKRYPVCPTCGESSYGFVTKTVRWVSDGWFKGGHWDEKKDPTP